MWSTNLHVKICRWGGEEKTAKNSIEKQVANLTNFISERRKDFMCVEIRISVKWKKIYYKLVSLSVSTKVEKKSIIMAEKGFCCLEK